MTVMLIAIMPSSLVNWPGHLIAYWLVRTSHSGHRKSKREDGTFSREDFTFYKEGNVYICPAFKVLTTTGKIMNDDILFYRGSTLDCAACAFKARCWPKEPSRKILRSIHEEARDVDLLVSHRATGPCLPS